MNKFINMFIMANLTLSCGSESDAPERFSQTPTSQANQSENIERKSDDANTTMYSTILPIIKSCQVEKLNAEQKKYIDQLDQNSSQKKEIDTLLNKCKKVDDPIYTIEETSETKKPDQPQNPPEDLKGYTHKLVIPFIGDRMSCDSIWQDRFVFQGVGPDYGKSFLLVWSDGKELYVPNSSKMNMDIRQEDYRKFQPGAQYSNNNPDIPSMEVYAARGTHPTSVTLYYNKP